MIPDILIPTSEPTINFATLPAYFKHVVKELSAEDNVTAVSFRMYAPSGLVIDLSIKALSFSVCMFSLPILPMAVSSYFFLDDSSICLHFKINSKLKAWKTKK